MSARFASGGLTVTPPAERGAAMFLETRGAPPQALLEIRSREQLTAYLGGLMTDLLRVAGTDNGAILLLGEDPDQKSLEQFIGVRDGKIVAEAELRALGVRFLPFDATLRALSETLKIHDFVAMGDFDHAVFTHEFRAYLETVPAKFVLLVALRGDDRLLGWIGLGCPEPMALDEARQNLFKMAARQAAIAIELACLAARAADAVAARADAASAQRQVDRLISDRKALTLVAEMLASDPSVDHMLTQVVHALREQLRGPDSAGALWLVDPEHGDQYSRLVHRRGETIYPPPFGEGSRRSPIDPALFRSNDPFVMPIDDMPERLRDLLRAAGERGAIVVPILDRSEPLGAFFVQLPIGAPDPSEEDLQFARILADHAAIALILERSSRAAQAEQRQAATLAERQRIARDLHDTLAQGLTGIVMHLQASQRADSREAASAHVADALDAARGALIDARRSVHALRSAGTTPIDFVVALSGVLKTIFAATEIVPDVTLTGNCSALPEMVQSELLRIAQEAATNVLRHSRAARFDVNVRCTAEGLRLRLRDDGIGFDAGRASDGFGLIGIRERAQRIGAAVELASAAGLGTALTIVVDAATISPNFSN